RQPFLDGGERILKRIERPAAAGTRDELRLAHACPRSLQYVAGDAVQFVLCGAPVAFYPYSVGESVDEHDAEVGRSLYGKVRQVVRIAAFEQYGPAVAAGIHAGDCFAPRLYGVVARRVEEGDAPIAQGHAF